MGRVGLTDGCAGNVVLVGPRTNPKGAVIVLPADNGDSVKTVPLSEAYDSLHPATVVEIFAVQERTFGNSGLPPMS